jgi:hypothetical protein
MEPPATHLLILRIWQEQLPDGRLEWRGKLQHPETNQTRHFRDWPALVPLLLASIRIGEEAAVRQGTAADAHRPQLDDDPEGLTP